MADNKQVTEAEAVAAAQRIVDGDDDTFGGMTSYDESRQKDEDVELVARFVLRNFGENTATPEKS